MSDGSLRAVRDDHLAALDVVIREHALDHALDPFGGQRLAVDLEACAVRLRAAKELTCRVERRFARLLGVADATELGLVLRTPAVVEEVAVDGQFDAVRA